MFIKNDSPMPINKKFVRSVANTTITGENKIHKEKHKSMSLLLMNSIKNTEQNSILYAVKDYTIYHKNYNANEYALEDNIQQNSPNKTIYMTYKKNIPNFVFGRWKKLNPDYTIEFNLDHDCISFLEKHFNNYIANLFKRIPTPNQRLNGYYRRNL